MSNPGVATSNAFAALQQNTGMLISQLNNPTSVPVPVPSTLQRCVVWDGIVEWIHPEGRVPRQMNQQPCEVWVPITDIMYAYVPFYLFLLVPTVCLKVSIIQSDELMFLIVNASGGRPN